MKINSEKLYILMKARTALEDMLDQAKHSISDAQEEANYHIGAMQSRYDTFKEEAQYLVAAQKLRAIEIEEKIVQCDRLSLILKNPDFKFNTIRAGAFFSVTNSEKEKEEKKSFLIIPGGNGFTEKINNTFAICVSENAPIVRPYIGLSEHDDVLESGEYIDLII